jgi:hypothetical protein
MNLDTFPDPLIKKDPIPGDAIPVSMIQDAAGGRELINISTGGQFTFDHTMNPLDLFQKFHPSSQAGVAVLVLNCLPQPLTLVETCSKWNDDFDNGPQLGYPAVIDSATGGVVNAHQIPGLRNYPRPSLHKRADGSPAQIAGLGLYRFQAAQVGGVALASRALAFACVAGGSKTSSPLLGVAFSYRSDRQGSGILSAVTVDLSKQGQGDTQSNLESLMNTVALGSTPHDPYEIGTGANTMTIWGVVPPGTPAHEPMVTLMVFVRDIASTFGF